jgi:hypothetical protein
MAKVDHSLSDNDRLTGRYFFNGGPTRNSSVYADPADTRTGADNSQHYVYASWTRTINATLVNDLRFTYIRRSFHSISAGLGGDYSSKLGLKGVPDNAFAQFVPARFSNLGINAQERQQYPTVSAIQQRDDTIADAWASQLLWRDGALSETILKSFTLGANYTWSRFFDNTNEVGATMGDNGGPYSNYCDRPRDYGPSAISWCAHQQNHVRSSAL